MGEMKCLGVALQYSTNNQKGETTNNCRSQEMGTRGFIIILSLLWGIENVSIKIFLNKARQNLKTTLFSIISFKTAGFVQEKCILRRMEVLIIVTTSGKSDI